jgi:hypothetical protein
MDVDHPRPCSMREGTMSVSEERFTVGCPKCAKRYVVTTSAIGKKATCKCGRSFIVEKPREDEDDDDDDTPYDIAGRS